MGALDGKRVVITGADGFIGSHLVATCVAEGADVTAFCIYNSRGSAGWLDDVPREERDFAITFGDVRDAEQVRGALAGADVVMHLAALIAIPYSYEAPRSFVDTNVVGTLNVLEAVRAGDVGLMINTSTSEVYGTPDTVPIAETHPLRGQSPYSASKIAADKMCEAYALSFGTPVVTLRPFNTFGPRQSARAVIPTILAQLLAGVDEVHLGALSPKRDFTYVTDTCRGYVALAGAGLPPGEVVQLGTGTTVSIGELFDLCTRVVGVDARVVTDEERVRPAGSEVEILQSDPSRAAELLGWRPTIDLEEGLRRTAAWLAPRVEAADAVRYHR